MSFLCGNPQISVHVGGWTRRRPHLSDPRYPDVTQRSQRRSPIIGSWGIKLIKLLAPNERGLAARGEEFFCHTLPIDRSR
jgi:hypothetical protein